MKVKNAVFLCFTAMIFSAAAHSSAEVNVRTNFSELNGYGEWIDVAGYGTVWRPDADRDWRPFTYGHWVYTNDGWMWDSDEPFGWIVCHYGDWYYDDNQGWIWLPGYSWSPARVSWHVTENEVGWAPLSPKPRFGHHQNTNQKQWTFAPLQFFTSFEIHNHLAIRTAQSSNETQLHISSGPPDRRFIERSVKTPIVSINPDKINITARERPLVRVEVQHGKRSNVEVPVGPKYKRVPVQNQPEQHRIMTFPNERSDRQEPFDNPPINMEGRSSQPAAKVHVRSRNVQENQDVDRHDNNQEKRKVKVEVRTR